MFSLEFLRTRGHTYKRRALDTTRKDDAGRNSIYQRLVNRLAHVPGGDQGCSGRGSGRGGRDGGSNGHRGRDVDDRKTKIRNSNLSREQLISRTSPHPLPLSPLVSTSHISRCLAASTADSAGLSLVVTQTTPVAGYTARLAFLRPEIPTVIGRQTVRLTVATE